MNAIEVLEQTVAAVAAREQWPTNDERINAVLREHPRAVAVLLANAKLVVHLGFESGRF